MKTIFMLLAVGIVLTACNKPSTPFDTTIVAVVDQTDKLPNYPQSKTLLAPFNLKANPWQGVEVKLVSITDKDINPTKIISLPSENRLTGNNTLRRLKVEHFMNQVDQALKAVDSIHSYPHSIVFRSIAQEAALLSVSHSTNRYLIVYSDLFEHSEISFYNPQTLAVLRKSPDVIEKQLEANSPIPKLTGIKAWFLFAPSSYQQNNMYMPIARFYESVYKAHHAQVHIANEFSLP